MYRRLTALLREAGCRFERQGKGSHEVWSSPITQRMFAIPRNIRNPVLAKEILKQAGLPRHSEAARLLAGFLHKPPA